MCQKGFGNLFGAFASLRLEDMAWTRGEPAIFKSSELVERGFCRDCGTPLSFRYIERDRITVSIGSLDEPARVAPVVQYGIEGLLPAFNDLHRLPARPTTEDYGATSRQHPDHD